MGKYARYGHRALFAETGKIWDRYQSIFHQIIFQAMQCMLCIKAVYPHSISSMKCDSEFIKRAQNVPSCSLNVIAKLWDDNGKATFSAGQLFNGKNTCGSVKEGEKVLLI